jgi:hypothetical protein
MIDISNSPAIQKLNTDRSKVSFKIRKIIKLKMSVKITNIYKKIIISSTEFVKSSKIFEVLLEWLLMPENAGVKVSQQR